MAMAAAASYFLAPNLSGYDDKPLLVRGNGDATVKKLQTQGHSAKNRNRAFSAFWGEMSILGSQEVITKIGSIAKIRLLIGPNRV
jgi:hypothetical protein